MNTQTGHQYKEINTNRAAKYTANQDICVTHRLRAESIHR